MIAKSRLSRATAVLLALWTGAACEEDPDTSGSLPAGGRSAGGGSQGINTTGVPAGTVKTYLIRSFATALAQPGVEKLFWFRAGYDPGHMDLYDAAGNTTAAYAAFKTLTSFWVQPTSITGWSSGSARGSIATLSGNGRVAIVWNDGSATPIQSVGLNVSSAHDQDGSTVSTTASLTGAPVFLRLAN